MRTASCEEMNLRADGRQQPSSPSKNVRPDCLLQIFPISSLDSLIALENLTYNIGRDRSCNFRIIDRSVSRHHAFIRHTSNGWHLVDLESTNGTIVNEEKISVVTLQHGDRVQFGNSIYQFLESNRVEGEYHHSVSSKIRQDDLLCIMNRRAFLEVFARAYRQSAFESRPLTVAMLDLDKFKSINDELGHQAGDDVLLEFVARAQRCCPENGTLARFGGEEFAILFQDFTLQQTLAYAEQIRMAVAEKPFLTNAGPVKLTVSMGLVEQDAGPSCGDQRGLGLINRADSLLLEAKQKGRNQICC